MYIHNFIYFCSMSVIFACQLLIVHIERIWHTCLALVEAAGNSICPAPNSFAGCVICFYDYGNDNTSVAYCFCAATAKCVGDTCCKLARVKPAHCRPQLGPPWHPLGAHLARFELKIARHCCCRAQVFDADVVLAARQNET